MADEDSAGGVAPDDPDERNGLRGGAEDEAAERERRRQERDERRRSREQRARRSLGERVGGAISAAGSAASEGRERLSRSEPERGRLSGRPEGDEPLIDPGDPGGGGRTGGPAGGGSGPTHADVVKRRLLAIAAAIVVIVVIVVLVGAVGGGGEEAAPVETVPAGKTTQLTIPEGLTRGQIAELASESKLKGSYLKASKRAPKGFDLKDYDAQGARSLEGFLFPATYDIEKGGTSKDLVARQLDAFEANLAEVNLKKAEKKNLTPYDIVIIASMIEREVSIPKERKTVAAVIYNRLAAGEPLGVDATLRYKLDNFTEPLLQSELEADSPYNTRTRTGLPPTPISNPGLASLQAAADPGGTDARFYVIKPGTCNEHFFTADAAEFEAARAEYQAALEAEGGSPTDCPE